MDLNTLSKIILQLVKSKNPNDLIKYSFLIIGFFFFIEGWDLSNIIIIVVIFLILLLIFKSDMVFPPKISQTINKVIDTVIPETIDTEKVKEFMPEIKEFKNDVKEISNYFIELKKKSNDKSFLMLMISVIKKLKIYVDEIKKVIISIENKDTNDYAYLSFQKINDLKKNLLLELESIYLKIDVKDDESTNDIISKIKNTIEKIQKKLEKYIDDDFDKNPDISKGVINYETNPEPYEK